MSEPDWKLFFVRYGNLVPQCIEMPAEHVGQGRLTIEDLYRNFAARMKDEIKP